jgi:hypothetical protein
VPFEVTLRNTALDAMTPRIVSCSLHTADPGGTGADEVTGGTYARQTPSWGAAAAAVVEIDTPMVFQIPAGNEIQYVGLWDTGPTWVGSIALTTPEPFNNDGELTVQEMTITATNA